MKNYLIYASEGIFYFLVNKGMIKVSLTPNSEHNILAKVPKQTPPLLTYFQAKKVCVPAIEIKGKSVIKKINYSPMHRI
ncbi:hypothetical protein [Algibacter lectus]|uniref:Uncharacterized protein n=1 Tax=Algibacter lectus TaxID=221126 RepID=A0A4R8MD59_9FLAO|nr:hypothetical protein [Algibacter lectus]MWW23557.1 hypothetical protein [Algibacter lectus]TDY63763.1 hypothetical protein DFQ06_0657 [Algibacter lectus]